jgi:hypothetical protein
MGKNKKEKKGQEVVLCPVGRFFQDLEETAGVQSTFFEHLNKSRIEFLKAIRSLVDERIEHMEKKASHRGKKKASRIKVE